MYQLYCWPLCIQFLPCNAATVKSLMLACPIFREFREPNKTPKLKGAISTAVQKKDEIASVLNYMVLIRQNKRGQNNLACKVTNF